MECRACDAGLEDDKCAVKGVVYSMSCTQCGSMYIGETGRSTRERFQEHYRDARAKSGKSPWGSHYRSTHNLLDVEQPAFLPFRNAKILAKESPLPSRKLMEATLIRKYDPGVNMDSEWYLLD